MKFQLFLITALFLNVFLAIHADEEESPYLYYYSRLLGGIIIERTDGRDSRHIGADVIPAGLGGIGGAGWSPSGNYFALYTIYGRLESWKSQAIVIDTEGQEVHNYLGAIPNPSFMQWSPDDQDILFVAGETERSHTFYWLIDAASGQLLADYGGNLGSMYRSEVIWDTDNEQVTFYILPELYNFDQPYRIQMRFDGTVLREPVTDDEYNSVPLEQDYDSDARYSGIAVSPSGIYTTGGSFHAILTNTQTDTQIELPLHSQGTSCHEYLWNKDEQYIITLSGTTVAGGGCGGAEMGITDSQGNLWREIGLCSWHSIACVSWLPEQVNIDTLRSGQPVPIQLDPIGIELTDDMIVGIPRDTVTTRLFCENDTTAFIRDHEIDKFLYRLTIADCPYSADYSEATDGVPIVLAYSSDHEMLVTFKEFRQNGLDVWIKNGVRFQHVLKLNSNGYELEFTEDGQSLWARNWHGWKVYSVQDILDRINESFNSE